MQKKQIEKVIKKKIDEWLESIKDEDVRELARNNVIVTGGCIVSMLMKEKINDFDIYFRDFHTTKAVAEYYVKEFIRLREHKKDPNKRTAHPYVKAFHPEAGTFGYDEKDNNRPGDIDKEPYVKIWVQSAGIVGENTEESQYQYFECTPKDEQEDYINATMEEKIDIIDEIDGDTIDEAFKEKYRPVFLTDNAITLSQKVQLIIRFFGEPDEIHKNYDFVHCTNYWDSKSGKVTLKLEALEAILAKRLIYVGSKYPICSFIRCRKFIKRGWHISAGQMLKICVQINQLDLTNINILRDQLTGVDTAYFIEVIDYLKANNKDYDMPYLMSVLDRMF